METSNHSHGLDSNPPRGPTESGSHIVPPSPISGSPTVWSLSSSGLVALNRTGSENDLRSGQPVSHLLQSRRDASSTLGDRPENPAPLRDYHGPVPAVAINQDAPQILEMPTLLSRRHIYRDISVMARRSQCIRDGIAARNRPELQTMKNATRRLQRDVFLTELNLFDNVLSKVQKTEASVISVTQSGPVYRLQAEDFDLLLTFLRQDTQTAQVAFTIIGRMIPKLPTFRPTGRSFSEWHSANDFEILSVYFRLEVENFVWELDNTFNFQHGMPRSIIARLLYGNLSEADRQFLNMKAFTLTSSELLRSLSRIKRPPAIVQQPVRSSSIVCLHHITQ
ncbi:hypothetical protein C8R43DRAFT_1208933 [Mycena crocata]|nr:hypothetical protein C8R43DRAFT_1208933 [Mycena crocata]